MSPSPLTLQLGALALALVLGGLTAALYTQLARAESPARALWVQYLAHLERELAFVRSPWQASQVARGQLAGSALLLVVSVALGQWAPLFLIPLLMGAPMALLRKKRDERVLEIEQQLDTWMLGLANALRASPALAVAIDYSAQLIGAPFSEELDLALKSRALGTPLDSALRMMADRVGSRTLNGVVSMLVIGRNTGGKLPDTLEVSAAQLREMARIDGVIRTKTAEGRGQTWVLALMPFGMLFAISAVDNDFFLPLTLSTTGYIIVALSLVFWIGAIVSAKKILEVDV